MQVEMVASEAIQSIVNQLAVLVATTAVLVQSGPQSGTNTASQMELHRQRYESHNHVQILPARWSCTDKDMIDQL